MTNACPIVATPEMARQRTRILDRLGGWSHRRWEGSNDDTMSWLILRRVRNSGLASFLSESGLQADDELVRAPPSRSKRRRSPFSRMYYDPREGDLAGIPDRDLLDHSFDLSSNGIEEWAAASFPYIEAVAPHIHRLQDLQDMLREYGLLVRCIEHGWWNDKTVGLIFMPVDAGLERALEGYQPPLGRDHGRPPYAR